MINEPEYDHLFAYTLDKHPEWTEEQRQLEKGKEFLDSIQAPLSIGPHNFCAATGQSAGLLPAQLAPFCSPLMPWDIQTFNTNVRIKSSLESVALGLSNHSGHSACNMSK